MGGDSTQEEKKSKTKTHEYGASVPCDLNIHDMTISMS